MGVMAVGLAWRGDDGEGVELISGMLGKMGFMIVVLLWMVLRGEEGVVRTLTIRVC